MKAHLPTLAAARTKLPGRAASRVAALAVWMAVGVSTAPLALARQDAGPARPASQVGRAAPRRIGNVLFRIDPGASMPELAAATWLLTVHEAQFDDHLLPIEVEDAAVTLGQLSEQQFVAELLATGAVLFSEPDGLQSPADTTPNDPLYAANQWQHPKISAPAAWDLETGDGSALVAVCDTGVLSTHPDLTDNVQLPGRNVVLDSTDTEPTNTDGSHNQHGTFVSGCVAAVGNNGVGMTGVCWNAKILPVKVSNSASGSAFTSDLAEAINWAADNGAELINVSYSGFESSTIATAAAYARTQGALVFYAAGNENANLTGKPDNADFILVGATDSSDHRSSFSNYGPPIDVVAPGTLVGSTTVPSSGNGNAQYAIGSGTSYACPIAVGVAALMLSANHSLTVGQVETLLMGTCDDLGQPGDDGIFGRGRVNAAEAVFAAINGTDSAAEIDSPAPGGTLDGSSVPFAWSGGIDADFYRLSAGRFPGQSDYFAANTSGKSIQAVNLPTDGSTVYVRLWTVIDGDWLHRDYTYTAFSGGGDKAAITSPAGGSTLDDYNVTFVWSTGNGVSGYLLACGSAAGRSDYYYSGFTGVTSKLVETLPIDGGTIYVRLWSVINGDWVYNDYTYTAYTGVRTRATVSSPAPGATLAGGAQLFSWNAGAGAAHYWVNAGDYPGSSRYFTGGGPGTSINVTGLPLDGSPVFVRLWTRLAGQWVFNDYAYTAFSGSGDKAVITSPAGGSTLSDFNVTFTWDTGTGVSGYLLACGSTPGLGDYYYSGYTTDTSKLVETLPADGRTIFARLYSVIGGNWVYNDYTYTAYTGVRARATMSSPAPGSTLSGATELFDWNAGAGVSQYWVNVGDYAGSSRYFTGGGPGTSILATRLPTDGSQVFVRLWSRLAGQWVFNDYVYTASGP